MTSQVNVLSAKREKCFGKDPLQAKDLSSIINANHFTRLEKLLDNAKISRKIVHGGQHDKTNLKIAPTIIMDVQEDSPIMNEEIFGPLLPVQTVSKIGDCFSVINAKEKPLASYLFTNDKKLKKEFVRSISSGGMIINDTILHFLEPGLPFGGVGGSGMGSYHGKFSFDTFSHKKALLKRFFAIDVPARYPPYSPWKIRFFQAVLQGNILGILGSFCGL